MLNLSKRDKLSIQNLHYRVIMQHLNWFMRLHSFITSIIIIIIISVVVIGGATIQSCRSGLRLTWFRTDISLVFLVKKKSIAKFKWGLIRPDPTKVPEYDRIRPRHLDTTGSDKSNRISPDKSHSPDPVKSSRTRPDPKLWPPPCRAPYPRK